MLTDLSGDLRYALRTLRRHRGFALAAILTIALGVGSNTAVFSVVRAVLLRPLPFRSAERLVMIWQTHPDIRLLQLTAPDFEEWRANSHSFEEIAAYTLQAMNRGALTGYGEPVEAQATMVSSNLLPMLGIEPLAGRNILISEDKARAHVALISENLWRRKFRGDRSIVGKPIQLDSNPFTVVGIVPQRKAFPVWTDLWIPLSLLEPMLQTNRQFHPLEVIARLRPGVREESAQAEMQGIARRLEQTYPRTNRTVGTAVVLLADQVSGSVRPALIVVWVAAGLILLIACVNVAHLLLERAASRSKEVAIRAAMGARLSQLLRLFLTESVFIAVAGGVLGFVAALYMTPVLTSLAAAEIPRLADVSVDRGVFVFALAISMFCGVLFGLPAAVQGARADLNETLKQGSGAAFGLRRIRFGGGLVIAEIALSLAVLIAAGLLVRSFESLLRVDPGFQPRNVLTMEVNLPASKYTWAKADQYFIEALLPRIRGVSGVAAAAAASTLPMTIDRTQHSRFATRFGIVGRTYEPGRFPVAQIRWVSEDYWRAMGIPLKRGRFLTENERDKPFMIVSEAVARRFFPGEDAVGKHLLMDVMTAKPSTVEIVGVVGDTRDFALDIDPEPTLYGIGTSPRMMLVVRTAEDPVLMTAAIRRAVTSANQDQVAGEIRTMDQIVADSLGQRRFALLLVGGFALIAISLTGIGIYGVIAYSVTTRTRELGLRMALGAQHSDVVRLLFRDSLTTVAPGLAIGCLVAFALTRLMSALLYHVAPTDPLAYGGAAAFLVLVALLATFIPARRATVIDPIQALREQ